MKNIFVALFLFTAILTGCEGIYDGKEFKIYEQDEPAGPDLPEIPEIGKKGIGKTTKGRDWSSKVSKTKSHWHYSWGSGLSIKEPDNIDFVPMIWGKGITEDKVNELKALKDEGKIHFLLGFNEPDGAEQANMTVDEAIEDWQKLEEVGVPLGSPGCVNPTGDWMKQFMQKVDENGLRVDFVCVHSYGGANAQSLLNKLEEIYNLYGKPIWITEFAVADWTANTPEENKYSPEQVLSFMQEILPALENLGYLHRYAWFPFSLDRAPGTSSALWDDEGVLTPLGQYYADFEPNTLIGPGKDDLVDPNEPDPDNIVVNGDFETGDISPWGGFKNGVTEATGVPYAGYYCGKIESNDGSLFQIIDLEPGATYEVKFYAKWESVPPKSFSFAVKEETGGKVRYFVQEIVANEYEWTLNTATFTASAEAQVRLLWYKGQVTPPFPPFYLDNVSCKKIN